MDAGELWTRWTVRVALALYVVALLAGRPRLASRFCRAAWTLGCLALLVHIGCAFGFYHGWSHEDAYETTARRTREVVGLDWGGGLYANYALALVWALDAAWWWLRPAGYRARPRAIAWTVQGFLAFTAFNAAVVFGVGAIRCWGLAATAAVLAAAGARFLTRAREPIS